MPKYRVVFISKSEYEVDAADDDKALEVARARFQRDMEGATAAFNYTNWAVSLIEDGDQE